MALSNHYRSEDLLDIETAAGGFQQRKGLRQCLPLTFCFHTGLSQYMALESVEGRHRYEIFYHCPDQVARDPSAIDMFITEWFTSYVHSVVIGGYPIIRNQIFRYVHDKECVATTGDITVSVSTSFLPELSSVHPPHYFFTYRIRIEMSKDALPENACQLDSRYWKITNANGNVEEVQGPGVVGEFPVMQPGKVHEYASCTTFSTTSGHMEGHYTFHRLKNKEVMFNITIPRFHMVCPPYRKSVVRTGSASDVSHTSWNDEENSTDTDDYEDAEQGGLGFPTPSGHCPRLVSGVFESSIMTYNYTQSREYCLSQNATLATLEQVTRAQNTSFQTCRYGWVKEQQIILARTTATKSCGSNHVGIIKQEPCGYYIAPSAYCYKINVVTGVFHVDSQSGKYNLTFAEANSTCAGLKATMATEIQLRVAHAAGFQTCRAGWVAEQKIFISRTTPAAECASGEVGIKEYPGTNQKSDVFCFRSDLNHTDVYVVYPPFGNSSMTYSEATQQCLSLGDSLASKEQLRSAPTPISDSIPGWSKDNDVVQFSSGNLTVTPCVNEPSRLASAYCFNPNMWLKITMICIIASIFIILLMAAAFMRG
ncbi:UNVERIFIED_CONTAM: hypothetical protein FKN15_032269 [Acipenser sinensis]